MSLVLNDVAKFISSKIEVSEINVSNYISTENMLPNKGGITTASSLPDTKSVREYIPKDILINNIRPYFKKIWYSDMEGGCSNDIYVLRSNENYDSKFLYYVLSSDDFFSYVMANAKGTKMPRGDKKAIQNYKVPNFSIDKQKKISSFLGEIDRKIEINKKLNKNNSSKTTIDNIRRIFSSFFSWLEDEDYIIKNPVRRIHRVKTGRVVKEVLTDENLEILRDKCKEIRDLAMVELLTSTGIRVGELVRLNIEDIDFYERECVVFGKGESERVVYFDARTKIHLMEYLQSRKDDNPALFVSLNSPYDRLGISGIETRLRELGNKCNINRVHPHKFRRTMATNAIDKGMPIEQVQKLLGHVQIDTTMQYAMVNQSNVKLAHRKFIG